MLSYTARVKVIWEKKDIDKEPGRLKCAVDSRFSKLTFPVASDSTQQISNPVKGCDKRQF